MIVGIESENSTPKFPGPVEMVDRVLRFRAVQPQRQTIERMAELVTLTYPEVKGIEVGSAQVVRLAMEEAAEILVASWLERRKFWIGEREIEEQNFIVFGEDVARDGFEFVQCLRALAPVVLPGGRDGLVADNTMLAHGRLLD